MMQALFEDFHQRSRTKPLEATTGAALSALIATSSAPLWCLTGDVMPILHFDTGTTIESVLHAFIDQPCEA